MVENTIKDSSVNLIYNHVVANTTDSSGLVLSTIGRTQARLLNIIDLNVVQLMAVHYVKSINQCTIIHTYNAIVNETVTGVENANE
jgi:hypothetical protein